MLCLKAPPPIRVHDTHFTLVELYLNCQRTAPSTRDSSILFTIYFFRALPLELSRLSHPIGGRVQFNFMSDNPQQ